LREYIPKYQKNKMDKKLPQSVHIWEVTGFVKFSDTARNKLKKMILHYGMRRLSRQLHIDRETIYSIYTKGRKKDAHSIKHILKIATFFRYDLNDLEKEITLYGKSQTHMYNFTFPFIVTPLHIRAVSIHGDGCFNRLNNQCSWSQKHQNIVYMESLLQLIFQDTTINYHKKDDVVSSITIPTALVSLTCKSLRLQLMEYNSIMFFKRICETSEEFQFQVFSQFIIDEGHLKGTTLTVSQKKRWSRDGFKILLDNLGFEYSKPLNEKHDITIYNFNFPKILFHLENAKDKYGNIAGLWFKEKEFIEACKKVNPSHYPLIRDSMKKNKEIFKKLSMTKPLFNFQDIESFGRTNAQVHKAIRCWKKNKLIERVGWNRYRILQENVE